MVRNKPCTCEISGFAYECCRENLVSSSGFTLCSWPCMLFERQSLFLAGRKKIGYGKKGGKELVLKNKKG